MNLLRRLERMDSLAQFDCTSSVSVLLGMDEKPALCLISTHRSSCLRLPTDSSSMSKSGLKSLRLSSAVTNLCSSLRRAARSSLDVVDATESVIRSFIALLRLMFCTHRPLAISGYLSAYSAWSRIDQCRPYYEEFVSSHLCPLV